MKEDRKRWKCEQKQPNLNLDRTNRQQKNTRKRKQERLIINFMKENKITFKNKHKHDHKANI